MLPNPRKKCSSCKNLALYGYRYQLVCEEHKKPDMYNLVEKQCSNCCLIDVLNDKNLCQSCGDFIIKGAHLAKQKEVKAFLDAREEKYSSYDRILHTQCGRERPDFVFETPTHVVILEVDEEQHKHYQPDCERIRMINISQAVGMPVIFLRYNPDHFKKSPGRIISTQRKEIMLKWLCYLKKCPPKDASDFLRVAYLFYDNYDPGDVKILTIKI